MVGLVWVLCLAATASGALATSPFGVPPLGHPDRQVCGAVRDGAVRCQAHVVLSSAGTPLATAAPTNGYFPADLQSAYNLPSSTAGSGQTVAIVDAYDDPNAEADLATYRSQFGLAPCTTANGCFSRVNQLGQTGSYPQPSSGWAEEESLDVDMVSATCPNCHILLVEANSNSASNLYAAENEAVALHATEISNSWAGGEYSSETSDQASFFNHPGIPITVASGDSGYGTSFPAASSNVISVGGTTLSRASNSRGWSEAVWSGTGSGCSLYITKPSWQHDTGCSRRTLNDVSADANPNTGVAVYDSYQESGWLVFGGTSVATPIVASVYALAGNGGSLTAAASEYSNATALFDITSGSNRRRCTSYLCKAVTGYDGPTGLGTPNGLGAF